MTSELINFNHLRCHSSSTALGTRTGYRKPTRRGTDENPPWLENWDQELCLTALLVELLCSILQILQKWVVCLLGSLIKQVLAQVYFQGCLRKQVTYILATKSPKLVFFVEWIMKNPKFSLISVPFLSEAVEVSQYYFFENWLMKLKYPNLRISEPTSNKFKLAYLYLPE